MSGRRPGRVTVTIPVTVAVLLLAVSSSAAQAPAAKYRIFRPDTPGPHAAVALVSGCDGFAPPVAPSLYERRAEQLRALGQVAVFVDYLGRRGLKSCAGSVTHDDAAQDLAAAVVWLHSQAGVDRSRITAMGWSYGARAVLVALVTRGENAPTFSRAVVHYPDCRALPPWKGNVPVLMLLGGDDDMTPAKQCQDVVKKLAAPASVKVVVYPGALHAFDVPELPPRMQYGLASIGHSPQATAAARKEIELFLGR